MKGIRRFDAFKSNQPMLSVLCWAGIPVLAFLVACSACAQNPPGSKPELIASGKTEFNARCAVCHGADGAGGARGPNIAEARSERTESESDLRDLIRNGIPAAGMPAFPLAEREVNSLVAFVRWLSAPAIETPVPGDSVAGESFFFGKGNCFSCHLIRGRGGILGPDLSDLGRKRKLSAIEQALRAPDLRITPGYRPVSVRFRDGREMRGLLKNESNYDLQLMDLEGHLHLLGRKEIAACVYEQKSLMPPMKATDDEWRDLLAYLSRLSGMEPMKPDGSARAANSEMSAPAGSPTFADLVEPKLGEWPTYNGRLSGNRYSQLDQIQRRNVERLRPRWIFTIPDSKILEVTPVVVSGVMYVTGRNRAYALDTRSGREIWRFERPASKGMAGPVGSVNRGVAVSGDSAFMVTDNAHLLALHRITGQLLWEVEMADYRQNYGATSAPLIAKDLVISGISGGDEGVRGFVAAYKASTGERVWRFWTVPAPGEPGAETWGAKGLEHACASTWLTGTYDPQLNLLYWPTGNPCPDLNGDDRPGDNLYSCSVLALDLDTGKLKWYYQFTPHDLHDWDATETPMLIDAEFHGGTRHLLAQANRNGFFYVLDRTDGKLLLAKPFVRRVTWASAVGPDGRPKVLPGTDPTTEGVKVCPLEDGATNWMPTAYSPMTRLFYVMALEGCTIFYKDRTAWEPGKEYFGGDSKDAPGEQRKKYLRAVDVETGKIAWEYPQVGDGKSYGGVLTTAGGLVFFSDDSGALAAVDAKTGAPLWHFHTSQQLTASPMTYMVDDRQYVAAAAGSNILAFALP